MIAILVHASRRRPSVKGFAAAALSRKATCLSTRHRRIGSQSNRLSRADLLECVTNETLQPRLLLGRMSVVLLRVKQPAA